MNKETDSILESLKANGTHEMDLPYIEVKGDSITIDASLNVDDLRIIVSELEKQKPRTKTEFVKVESDLAWELVKDFEEGVEFYTCSKGLHTSKNIGNLLSVWCDGDLHRKVETEIDERDEFVEAVESLCNEMGIGEGKTSWIAKTLFDSGEFKLVE